MSYSQEEIEQLKENVENILNESFFSKLHEMKKKLTVSHAKQQEQAQKIEELIDKMLILKRVLETLERKNNNICKHSTVSNNCLSRTALLNVLRFPKTTHIRENSVKAISSSSFGRQSNSIIYTLKDRRKIFTSSSSSLNSKKFLNTSSNLTSKMSGKVISGKETADEIRSKLKGIVESHGLKPKLVIVQVGGREDSNVYIRMKIQFAQSIGATAELVKLDRDVTQAEVASTVDKLNNDGSVHGIITQLPFDCSKEINSDEIVNMIDPSKDVDGLSVYNAGKLSHGELDGSSFVPCTPNGCMELIRKSGVKIEGSHSVVIGRSKIVGSPMAQLLLWHNSTVTICHSRTKNLEEICRQADILIAAVGRPQMVKKSWLKPGVVVVDCGINVIPDASKKSGTRLVGDVDFDECSQVASAITPVPGGVGPMTVAMLISNTVESAKRRQTK